MGDLHAVPPLITHLALQRNENLINAAMADVKLKKFINVQKKQEKRKQLLVK